MLLGGHDGGVTRHNLSSWASGEFFMSGWMKSLVIAIALSAAACSKDPEVLKKQYVASGDKYFADKKYPDAIIQYRNAIAVDARFAEARTKLAASYEAAGDIRNAAAEYVRAADLLP